MGALKSTNTHLIRFLFIKAIIDAIAKGNVFVLFAYWYAQAFAVGSKVVFEKNHGNAKADA